MSLPDSTFPSANDFDAAELDELCALADAARQRLFLSLGRGANGLGACHNGHSGIEGAQSIANKRLAI